jgi:hypothetical protein
MRVRITLRLVGLEPQSLAILVLAHRFAWIYSRSWRLRGASNSVKDLHDLRQRLVLPDQGHHFGLALVDLL